MDKIDFYCPKRVLRIVTATSLFDGHDAAINIMRRIIQDTGVEVIHLGHNRSAKEIVNAAIEEDANAIAISCYQGGHVEFFKYLVDLLKERNASHIQIFGGGGGVIVPREIKAIESYGVQKIFSPEDGRRVGLQGIISSLLEDADYAPDLSLLDKVEKFNYADPLSLSRAITACELAYTCNGEISKKLQSIIEKGSTLDVPVIGITGTGGAGKSSMLDELLLRFTQDYPEKQFAVISIDPTRHKTGGALLGDRIRMNALKHKNIYMRSLATRQLGVEVTPALESVLGLLKQAEFDLILVETAGIGQGDAAIIPMVDLSIYVMTSEYGAGSQLEKIEMLDAADFVVINKFERQGSEDALREVRKQWQRNHKQFDEKVEDMPVYGTMASRFNDKGMNSLYVALVKALKPWTLKRDDVLEKTSEENTAIVPNHCIQYLSEVANTVRTYHLTTEKQSHLAEKLWQCESILTEVNEKKIQDKITELNSQLSETSKKLLTQFDELKARYQKEAYEYKIKNTTHEIPLFTTSLSGTKIPKVMLPSFVNYGEKLKWARNENAPGYFPFTAGLYPFRRHDEGRARMFAGEGGPEKTNARFHLLAKDQKATRLSTAFDSVTLYGEDPTERLDIYGKIGNSGVSIATLDDMEKLYDGFDLISPNTSVSMTINGPAPILLAMFFNVAFKQQSEKFALENKREANEVELEKIKEVVLTQIRGTVQADILKEDQGQNTCIFALEFAMRMMGDMQTYFVGKNIKNFYSVSISGYHIAEAGANPITQAAFTLANGFTYVEYYLSRGMAIDEFASNLSFFFSLGMDPEYAVINRVARRIWAIAMKEKYGANERSQKLKTHIQTSGRSLHSQDMHFNDIRTTLEALTALNDNCSSLHTNSFDEALTTPTSASVRMALAIQLIIDKEYGPYKNENFLQGSFFIEALTNLVEEAILKEFECLNKRGGVLGAMELAYQRAKIQSESLSYEQQKTEGTYPLVGVNMFVDQDKDMDKMMDEVTLIRSSDEEKQRQIKNLENFKKAHLNESQIQLTELKRVATSGENIFECLMEVVKHCSLGEITSALYEVGGEYRRNM